MEGPPGMTININKKTIDNNQNNNINNNKSVHTISLRTPSAAVYKNKSLVLL